MTGTHSFPWAAVLIAILASLALLAGGAALWLALSTGLLWGLSLLLAGRSRPVESAVSHLPPPDKSIVLAAIAREAMDQIIEPAELPMLLTDGQRIVSANRAARKALGGHIIGQATRVALRHPDAVRLLDAAEGGSVTIRGLTGAGSLWQLYRCALHPTNGGDLWLIELIDRTAEADVSRAHTDFVANASHELRTPLSSIIGYTETLVDEQHSMDSQTSQRFMAIVLREARRMQSLVADLMSLSLLEAEKHDVPTTSLDLGQMAARVVGEFTGCGSVSGERLTLTTPEKALQVTGDSRQLEQVLRNLIDNSLKYGDPGCMVDVVVSHDDKSAQAQFSVSDHGAGIASDHLPHLTRRFYRTDPGRSRAAGGTGLGLAIVKHVVERHRGQLDISSTLGVGTLVAIRLPLAPLSAMIDNSISSLS